MDPIVRLLKPKLDQEGIPYRIEGTALRIVLPHGFGELEIASLDGNDTIVGLVGEDWHTHGDVLQFYGGSTPDEAIFLFLKKVFAGDLHLLEIRKDGKKSYRSIQDDKTKVLKYLQPDEEAIFFEET